MILLALLFQVAAADSVYATPALRDFITRAAVGNRAPPPDLAGYTAAVETELALILRDSLGRESVGQLEQLAARAEWERSGRYLLHVVGFRSQSLGTPYSALTFTRMYSVPMLYGNRLVVGINDGIPPSRKDSLRFRKRQARDTAQGREPLRAVHPLADDRDTYYRFRGGDTVATLHSLGRTIHVVRVTVETVRRPTSNFVAFIGELDFDADRHQLVRMRGRLASVTSQKTPLFARTTGSIAIAYMEFENAEVNGRYWLPTYQRSEFQAQMGLLGDVRPVFRIVSRFREFSINGDTIVTLAAMDSMTRVRSRLSFASKDSVSRYGEWRENLGAASSRVGSDDFDDIAPDVWKPTGRPRVDYWPRRLEDVARYNRVEGMFTGLAGSIRFRDRAPGLSARASLGWAWEERTARGTASASLARSHWINTARIERGLTSTNDFLLFMESGLSIGPLFMGIDDNDYLDRWLGAYNLTRIIGNVDRAMLTNEIAYVADRPETARLQIGVLGTQPFRANRPAARGNYARASSQLEWHPRVTGEGLSAGVGAKLYYEIASGDLDWQRAEVRLAARRYWHGVAFASRVDAGAIRGAPLPPQVMYELGGVRDLPSYTYKEFGGDRAAIGRGLASYQFPVLRTPFRFGPIVIPGLSPGIAAGAQAGWAEASTDAARAALLALGSTPTGRVRATADVRFTLLSGALGVGLARPVDRAGPWKPFFVWGGGL